MPHLGITLLSRASATSFADCAPQGKASTHSDHSQFVRVLYQDAACQFQIHKPHQNTALHFIVSLLFPDDMKVFVSFLQFLHHLFSLNCLFNRINMASTAFSLMLAVILIIGLGNAERKFCLFLNVHTATTNVCWTSKKKQTNPFSFPEFVELNCNEPQVAEVGRDSLLECVLKTTTEATNLKILSVTWKRYSGDGSEPDVVLEFREGKTYPSKGYSLAEPFWDNKNRNVSLLITKAAVQHVGFYECEVGTDSGSSKFPEMMSFNVTGKLLP